MEQTSFERRLVDALQPIRSLAVAHALYALWECDAYDKLVDEPGLSESAIAGKLRLDSDRLRGLLTFLANEGYVDRPDGGWALTERARGLSEFRPWFTLLVGGYAQAFADLPNALRAGSSWARRDAVKVGAGSCGMSLIDILPPVERLLARMPQAGEFTLIDAGCGDALFLCEILRRWPQATGIGLEISAETVAAAACHVARYGLSQRIEVRVGSLSSLPELDLPSDRPACILTSFVLQEILRQEGEDALLFLMRSATSSMPPGSHWLVFEIDYRGADLTQGLARAYYNPYFLLHAVTEQQLASAAYWKVIFERADLDLVAVDYPDDEVDSTKLEVGFLLAPSRSLGI